MGGICMLTRQNGGCTAPEQARALACTGVGHTCKMILSISGLGKRRLEAGTKIKRTGIGAGEPEWGCGEYRRYPESLTRGAEHSTGQARKENGETGKRMGERVKHGKTE